MDDCIAVIIPCRNREKLLPETLESCRGQTYKNFEVMVVDDGSDDGTAAAAQEYASRDERFKVLSVTPRGQCACRNEGVARTRGKWIKFLDSDDLLPEWSLEHQMHLARTYQADIVAGKVEGFWSEELNDLLKKIQDPRKNESVSVFSSLLEMNRKYSNTFNELLIRRELVKETGGFDVKLRAAEEINLYFRITMRHPELRVVHGNEGVVLLKRYDLNSLAVQIKKEKRAPWGLRSHRSSIEDYLRGGYRLEPEFQKLLFGLFYNSMILAARNDSMEEAMEAHCVWKRLGSDIPELSPWYHALLHRFFGFWVAEKTLLWMRRLRDTTRQLASSRK